MSDSDRRSLSTVVAFDLDDTLYPEFEYSQSALRVAAAMIEARTGATGLTSRVGAINETRFPAPGALQRALAEAGIALDDADLDDCVEVMRAHSPQLTPFGDVRGSLERLRPRAIIAVVTEGRSVTQRAKLRALGLADLIDDVVVSQELPPPNEKVTGAPYRALRERHPAAVRFYMIGDNPIKDGEAAEREGLVPLLVRRPGHRYVHPGGAGDATFADVASAVASLLRDLERSSGAG